MRFRLGSLLLTVAVVLAWPGVGAAVWYGIRNDLQGPVVVQVGVVTSRGAVARAAPSVFQPGEKRQDCLLQAADLQISVYEPRTLRLMYQTTIHLETVDRFYSLRMDPPGRILLVPARFPDRTPGRPGR